MRVWERVKIGSPVECWPYEGFVNQANGYGYAGGSTGEKLAHRAMLVDIGYVLEENKVFRKCNNKTCCNPAHLAIDVSDTNPAIYRSVDVYIPESILPQVYEDTPPPRPVKLNQDGTPRKAYTRIKENPNHCKLTQENVNEIIELYSKNVTPTELGKQFKVSRQTIYNIVNGTSWKQGKE
jgi:hypothetical protein